MYYIIFFGPNLVFAIGGEQSSDANERLILDKKNTKWEILTISFSSKRNYGCSFVLNNSEVLLFGGSQSPSIFMIFNTKILKMSRLKQKFENCQFYSSKPIYILDSIWIARQYIWNPIYKLDSIWIARQYTKKIYKINPQNYEYEEGELDF